MARLSLLSLKRTLATGHALSSLRDNGYFNVYLDETPATDDGIIAATKRLSNLKLISLKDTGVGDASARALASLKRLDEVRLSGTRITDAGLAVFSGHPCLEIIYVERCNVAPATVNEVKNASPRNLTVWGP
jgi:hypothetical protein